jgi:hypothetical protein
MSGAVREIQGPVPKLAELVPRVRPVAEGDSSFQSGPLTRWAKVSRSIRT